MNEVSSLGAFPDAQRHVEDRENRLADEGLGVSVISFCWFYFIGGLLETLTLKIYLTKEKRDFQ